MNDQELLRKLLAIAARLVLGEAELAALCGISVSTARMLCVHGVMPRRPRCRGAVHDFVVRSASARRRTDLRLPPERVLERGKVLPSGPIAEVRS